jgi:hypothetical protein
MTAGSTGERPRRPRAIELGPMSPDELAWIRRVGDFIDK